MNKVEIPSQIYEHIPKGYKIDLKTYLTMEYTARVVKREGNNFEFKLKIHPEACILPFLDPNHDLHQCYNFLKKNTQLTLFHTESKQIPESLHDLYKGVFKDEIVENESVEGREEDIENNDKLIVGYSDSD